MSDAPDPPETAEPVEPVEPTTPDDLYGLDPAEFIAARDRLARRLRADGRRDEASEVKKLRRPPQSTWALNLLARTDPDRIDAVLAAATALRDALADGGADRRAAQADYRDAIDSAVAAASELADVTGDDMRTRIRTNLLAAGVDEDLAVRLQHGTLPDDQEAPGFGGTPTIGPIAPRADRPARPPRTAPRPSRKHADGQADADQAAPAEVDAHAGAEAREAAAARARQAEDELARKRLARKRAELGRELDRLQKKARRLEDQAVAAEDRAGVARRAADEAAAAAAEIADQLDQLDQR
ncbi:MAG: hypothetical protein ACXWCB_01575 [Acidimicrobiales bacterium]